MPWLAEYVQYIKTYAKWWVAGVLLSLLLLAALAIYSQKAELTPFLYNIF